MPLSLFLGSWMILTESPPESEDATPIDIIYSKIAAEESRMFEGELLAWISMFLKSPAFLVAKTHQENTKYW